MKRDLFYLPMFMALLASPGNVFLINLYISDAYPSIGPTTVSMFHAKTEYQKPLTENFASDIRFKR